MILCWGSVFKQGFLTHHSSYAVISHCFRLCLWKGSLFGPVNLVSVCERAKPFGVKQDRDNKRGGGYHVGRKWLGLFVCQAFVCFPVGQIYLGGSRSEACRWKLATRMARYTVIDSCLVMWFLSQMRN